MNSDIAILCVDDEPMILQSLSTELRAAFADKYFYEFAESAQEGLELIEELNQDHVKVLVLISDWLMPGMRGDEFLIQVHQTHPHIVKVMLTGQADGDAVERARAYANLHAYLRKPWDPRELVETVKVALGAG